MTQSLTALMQQQIQQVDGYILYLDKIKQAISSNDSDALQLLVQNPPAQTHEIEQIQQHQLQILQAAGYRDNAKALDEFIANSPEREALTALQQTLEQSLKQLEQSLFINTLLLQKSQHRVKQSIRLLSGHDIAAAPSSYTRKGDANSATDNKHIIAQA